MLEFCPKAAIQGILVFLGIRVHLDVHLSLSIQLLSPHVVLDAVYSISVRKSTGADNLDPFFPQTVSRDNCKAIDLCIINLSLPTDKVLRVWKVAHVIPKTQSWRQE